MTGTIGSAAASARASAGRSPSRRQIQILLVEVGEKEEVVVDAGLRFPHGVLPDRADADEGEDRAAEDQQQRDAADQCRADGHAS